MTKRGLDLAKLIKVEPDVALGDPAAVDRVAQALAKVTGAILSAILVRDGEDALENAVQRIATVGGVQTSRDHRPSCWPQPGPVAELWLPRDDVSISSDCRDH